MGGGGGVAATDTQISTSELTKDLIIPAKLLISLARNSTISWSYFLPIGFDENLRGVDVDPTLRLK